MLDARLTGFELRPVRHKARFEDDPIDFRQTPAGREILQSAPAAGAPHPTGEFGVWINRAENRALIDRARMQYAALERDKEQRNRQAMPIWHQLVVNSVTAVIVRPTRVGVDPFDDDPGGQYRCPLGHLLGLNLLSELSIRAVSTTETDFVCSRQFVGVRRGHLRPRRVILASPKVHRLFEAERIKGAYFEVAHLL